MVFNSSEIHTIKGPNQRERCFWGVIKQQVILLARFLVALTLVFIFASLPNHTQAQNIQTYDIPGTYSFTVPQGVTQVNIKAWGGGGGGSGKSGKNGGTGGGGGGFAYGVFYVNENDIITIVVGGGGTGGSNNKYGVIGGNSIVNHPSGTITANGGTGGTNTGGSGGSFTISVSGYGYTGGTGANESSENGGGGGGGAGDSSDGNSAVNTTGGVGGNNFGGAGGNGSTNNVNGGTGSAYGGGGGGASTSSFGGNGGNGGVILSWSTCSLSDTPVLSATSVSVCEGESTTLSVVSGSLNDADHWQWYSASCGGTPIGQGSSINVSPLVTTTYYVRGEGNCDGTSCAEITITVSSLTVPDLTGVVTNVSCPSSADGAVLISNLPYALNFDGASQYVDFGTSFLSNQSSFTVEGWINTSQVGRSSILGQDNAIEFGFAGDGRIELWSEGLNTNVYSSSAFPADGNWHHVAGVGTGTEMRIYIDGALVGSATHASTTSYGTSTATTKIGGYIFDATNPDFFSGEILKVGFWNRALSENEIIALSSEMHNYSSSETGLISGYNFFEGSGTSLSSVTAVGAGALIGNSEWTDIFTYSWSKLEENFSTTTRDINNITSGTYTVDVTFGSCSKTKSFTVLSEDTESPVAICKSNIDVYLDESGEALITPEMIDGGSYDNCEIDTMWVSPSVIECPVAGSGSEGGDVYSATVPTTDGATVTITLSNLSIIPHSTNCSLGYNYDISFDYVIEYSGTNSLVLWTRQLNFVFDDDAFDAQTTALGSVTSVITSNNQRRDESDCNTVTFSDLVVNSITWDIHANLISNQTVALQKEAGSSSAQNVTLTVQDKNGNTSICSTTVTVLDTISPNITCPSEIIQSVDPGSCLASEVILGEPTTSDNCAVDTVTNDAPSTFSIGTTSVTWTVTDVSGNTNTCRQNVTIVPEEDIDVEVEDLGNSCQSGETGSTTMITWDITKIFGSTDWTFDYEINEGATILVSRSNVAAYGNTQVSFEVDNETAQSKTFIITISNVKDACGADETNTANNSDSVTLDGIPDTGDIITN